MDWRSVVVLVMAVVLMEFLLWFFWVLNVRERRGRKERGNGRNREKERRRKKRKYWKKKRIGKIMLKKEYKNIIYIKYNV